MKEDFALENKKIKQVGGTLSYRIRAKRGKRGMRSHKNEIKSMQIFSLES